MFEVFTEEIEVLIKDGVANLYWYRGDLQKAWVRSGVDQATTRRLFALKDNEDRDISKRKLMDHLYQELRAADFNRRLEVSRNFVRILIEQKSFTPQSEKHRVEVAERAALKLREIIAAQRDQQEYRETIRRRAQEGKKESYESRRADLNFRFVESMKLEEQKRGYELERIFSELLEASGIPMEGPFRIVGEQIDGALKYDGHYYLVELRWRAAKADQQAVAGLYLKVEGKFEARGIFISMNGFSQELIQCLPKGKEIKVILLDGMHLANVLSGQYTFQELLEHAISHASLKGVIYSPPSIEK